MADIDLDLEDARVRAAHMPAFDPISIPQPLIVPKGIDSTSSIAPVSKNVLYDLMKVHERTEELLALDVELLHQTATQNFAEQEEISTQRIDAVKKEAEAAKARATWGTLSTIAQYISGVGTALLGVAIFQVPGGQLPGGALVLSGVIGLTNRGLNDTDLIKDAAAWLTKSEELQKSYIEKFDSLSFYLELGLAVVGGIGAWKSGALAAARINGTFSARRIETVITAASTAMSAVGRFGASYYEKKIAYFRAQMREYDTKTTLNQFALQEENGEISKMIDFSQSQTEALQRAIQTLAISQD